MCHVTVLSNDGTELLRQHTVWISELGLKAETNGLERFWGLELQAVPLANSLPVFLLGVLNPVMIELVLILRQLKWLALFNRS